MTCLDFLDLYLRLPNFMKSNMGFPSHHSCYYRTYLKYEICAFLLIVICEKFVFFLQLQTMCNQGFDLHTIYKLFLCELCILWDCDFMCYSCAFSHSEAHPVSYCDLVSMSQRKNPLHLWLCQIRCFVRAPPVCCKFINYSCMRTVYFVRVWLMCFFCVFSQWAQPKARSLKTWDFVKSDILSEPHLHVDANATIGHTGLQHIVNIEQAVQLGCIRIQVAP